MGVARAIGASALGVVIGALAACTSKEPLRVGFVAQLTGVQAELGVQQRNGAELAFEETNGGGGVARRRLELVAADDLGTPDGARAADRELIRAGVVAIIGHATSGQTIAGLAVTEAAGVVMLSPSASSPALSGKKDSFFRIVQTVVNQATRFARRVRDGRGVARLAVLSDGDNAAYSTAYLDAFAAEYQARGGKIVARDHFSSREQQDLSPQLRQLRASAPEGLLIIAADVDTALIAQRTRLMGWTVPLFTSSWAQTETLIANGGQAVEGLEIELISALNSQSPEYLAFSERYRARFGQVPSFGAVLGYEAAQVMAAALRATGGKADALGRALTGIKDFKGVSDTFSIDAYGDAERPIHLGVVRDRRFVSIEAGKRTEP
jgi:branched-chain amino acid transport system substrate-binding protein